LDDQIQEIGHETHASPSFVGRHALVFGAEQDSSGGSGFRGSGFRGSGFRGVRTSAVDVVVAGHLFRRVHAADVLWAVRDATARRGPFVDAVRPTTEKAGRQSGPPRHGRFRRRRSGGPTCGGVHPHFLQPQSEVPQI